MAKGHDVTVRVYGLEDDPPENCVVGYVVRVVDTDDQFVAAERACKFVNENLGGLHHLGAVRGSDVSVINADAGINEDDDYEDEEAAGG